MWFTYIIASDNSYYFNHTYIGITTDPFRRILQHNGQKYGGAKNTRAKRPYRLVAFIECDNKSQAIHYEFLLKKKCRGKDFNHKMKLFFDKSIIEKYN